jgi:hypothetical protein
MIDLSCLVNKINLIQTRINDPDYTYNIDNINQNLSDINQKIVETINIFTKDSPLKKRKT